MFPIVIKIERYLVPRARIDKEDPYAQTAHALKDKRKSLSRESTQCHERHAKLLYAALLMGWSPEKVRLQMKRETPELRLSLGALYRRIAADKTQGGNLYTKLPRFGKSRCKGGKCNRGRALIPDRVDSIQRPQVMEKRSRIGDWEGDTGHGENAYLVTLAERQSRLVLIGKVVDRVETVAQCLSEWLRRVDNGPTIKLDNGGDFAHHDQVAKSSQATVYFAKPYASYQRGTENTNGLIRDFWPKGTDVKPLDDTEIRHREFCLNMPLSVVLGGLTPLEIDTGRSVALICVNPAVSAMCTIVYMIYT